MQCITGAVIDLDVTGISSSWQFPQSMAVAGSGKSDYLQSEGCRPRNEP
jgi:hypothetical protein